MIGPNSAGAQDAFGFAQGVRLLLPFGVAWLSFWSLGHFTRTFHMNTEKTFNAIFWTLFASMFLMRFWFGFRVWRTGERILPDRAALQREGFWTVALDRLFYLLVAGVVLLWFQGNSLQSLAFPAPDWLRWAGVALGIASVGLFAWTHAVLGRFWSTTLQLRPDHQLITAGPYARIRHPMYSAILGWLMSLGLVGANWTAFVLAALGTLIVLLRTQGEEKMMLEQFGNNYREYMRRTGRLLPVIRELRAAQERQPYAFLGCLLVLLLLIAIFFIIPHA
jgi:protein-S-isoprenylcysteine O-methyltransferase Ste14